MPSQPVPYDPSFEYPDTQEAEMTAGLRDVMLEISHKTHDDTGHAMRSVHAKSHALLRGTLTVATGLPPHLAQGLFAQPGSYDTIMRLSTPPGDILSDLVTVPHAASIKIIGVEGERVAGSETDRTQDFLMVNGKAFQVEHLKQFLRSLKLLAPTTDRVEGLKIALSAAMRRIETALEAIGIESANVKAMGGATPVHPLGDSFFTQVPVLYGSYMAKISLVPSSANLVALIDMKVNIAHRHDALREEIAEILETQGGEWRLQVQLCTNIDTMPIENPAEVWPEDESPYVTVATLSVPSQRSWSGEKAEAYEDNLSFNPWHALAAHRPLGAINRARKPVYAASVAFRREKGGCPLHEPSSVQDVEGYVNGAGKDVAA